MIAPTTLPSAVLLDWDNTLVDSWPNIYESLRETFIAMNHAPWTLEETKKRVHLSLRDSFPVLFGNDWQCAMKIYYRAYERRHPEKLAPLPGAKELLDELAGKEIYVALVSNKTGSYLRIEVEYLGWKNYFGEIIPLCSNNSRTPFQSMKYLSEIAGLCIKGAPKAVSSIIK